jgi:leader peptidase (prepilin peptidase) / N-methyltransferase
MPVGISAAFAGVLGAIIGSFLNVVAYRLPRRESLVRPGSHCPGCGAAIKPYDNIPVLGWLMLGGHCRNCGERISPRYPLVEAICAVLAVGVVLTKSSAYDIVLGLMLIAVLVPVALIDLEYRIIPNKITLPAAIAAVVAGVILRPSAVPEQLIAGAAAGGFLLIFALAYPRGMGMGDVKLALLLGAMLGRTVPVAMLLGLVSGFVPAIFLFMRHGVAARKIKLPFGPFLALGGVIALFAGHDLLSAYWSVFHR